MVVDDHALVRDMLAQSLSAEPDIEVVAVAPHAQEAMEKAGEWRPDVILMDIDMPGMSPFEASRQIRAASPSVRLVFLSAHVNDQYIDQALEIEASGYLSKEYLADGMPKKGIANLLDISPKTVEKHCDHIMDKLDIHDRVKLARYAIREGLTQP
jgi:DNA-binding NarL/FixJ family response regulator